MAVKTALELKRRTMIKWKFWKRNKPAVEDSKAFDFDAAIGHIASLSSKAQTTFGYRFIGVLPDSVLKTLQRYIDDRLKKNSNGEATTGPGNFNRY